VLAGLVVVVGSWLEIEEAIAGSGWKTWAEFWGWCESAAWRICCCWMLRVLKASAYTK